VLVLFRTLLTRFAREAVSSALRGTDNIGGFSHYLTMPHDVIGWPHGRVDAGLPAAWSTASSWPSSPVIRT